MARKRKPGPRTKSGRLSRAYKSPRLRDQGTDELQAKRQAAVGEGADLSLSSTMPGVLYARGHLDRDQYAEALEYRRVRCALYGPPWPSNGHNREASEARIAKLTQRFEAMCAVLTTIQKLVLANVCVFDQEPMWYRRRLQGQRMRVVDEFERTQLIEGLNALIGGKQRRAA